MIAWQAKKHLREATYKDNLMRKGREATQIYVNASLQSHGHLTENGKPIDSSVAEAKYRPSKYQSMITAFEKLASKMSCEWRPADAPRTSPGP